MAAENVIIPQQSEPESRMFLLSCARPGDDFMTNQCEGDDHNNIDYNIDFTRYSITEAFVTLMSKIARCMKVPQFDLGTARAACISVTADGKFQDSVRQVQSFDSLVKLLAENPIYCNWMDVRLLEVLAVSSQNKNLINLIDGFKESVYSRTLEQAFRDIPSLKKNFSKYKDLIPTSQFKNPDDMKVKELLAISRHLPIEVLAPHIGISVED